MDVRHTYSEAPAKNIVEASEGLGGATPPGVEILRFLREALGPVTEETTWHGRQSRHAAQQQRDGDKVV